MIATELPAGPELDVLVAERVMGWHLMPNRTCYADAPRFLPADEWNPSTDISHAWEVVERLGLSVTFWPGRGGGRRHFWAAGGYPHQKDLLAVQATGDTAPLAICRAALLACACRPGDGRNRA